MGNLKIQRTPTIRRMPTYLHKLYSLRAEGRTFVSCTELAAYMNIELIVARKDIALTGLAGHRRLGYVVDDLIDAIRKYIGWDKELTATLVGAGALGSALLGYRDFPVYGLKIASVFDADPAKIGHSIHGHRVCDFEKIHTTLKTIPQIGIICVSGSSAQHVADRLVALGIKYIWNFANICLKVPDGVVVQREVIAGGLAVLAAKMKAIAAGDIALDE